MTAKHRKGKSNHKQEDNFFKNEAIETEVRAGGNNYTLLSVLVLIMVICGATGAWFCFQQHQTLTHLTDNLVGIQMKIVKLQSSHEELRQSKSKQHVSESVETRLTALEESYALTQKQVGMALATAEQLKTSDLPAQVLSLHTEMKARLAEMQQATASVEQLSQLQSTLKEKSEEFEEVRIQMAGLATLNGELSHKVEVLTESLGEVESMLGEKVSEITTISATLDGQTTEVLTLKDQLDKYQVQLEASILEMATVRELLENEQSQGLQQASVKEQLNTLVGATQPPAEPVEQTEEHAVAATEDKETEAAASEEEEEAAAAETGTEETEIATATAEEEEQTPPAGEEQDASSLEEEGAEAAGEGEAVSQDAAPVEQENTGTEENVAEEEVEAAEEGEIEHGEAAAASEKEEVDTTQAEEEDKKANEEETQEESAADENQEATGEDESEKVEEVMESEGEAEELDVEEEEQQDVAAEEPQEAEEEEEEEEAALEDDASPEDK